MYKKIFKASPGRKPCKKDLITFLHHNDQEVKAHLFIQNKFLNTTV